MTLTRKEYEALKNSSPEAMQQCDALEQIINKHIASVVAPEVDKWLCADLQKKIYRVVGKKIREDNK